MTPSANPNSAPPALPTFSPVVLVAVASATVLRIFLLLNTLPSTLMQYLQSPAVASVMVDPVHTLRHLREGRFLSSLSPGCTLDGAYVGNTFHLPPLILALFEPVLSLSDVWQGIALGLILLVADAGVALCLHRIGTHCLTEEEEEEGWESKLELQMDEKIHPRRGWAFGITFPNAHVDDGISSGGEAVQEEDDGQGTLSSEKPGRGNEALDDGETWGATNGKLASAATPPTESRSSPAPSERLEAVMSTDELPRVAALLYYCNPIPILAASLQSLQSLWYLLLLILFWEAISVSRAGKGGGSLAMAAFYLASLTYAEGLFSLAYSVPALLWMNGKKAGGIEIRLGRSVMGFFCFFLLWTSCLHFLSYLVVGDAWQSVLSKTFGHAMGFVGLGPNMGMHWYFFIQMFDRFRRYFVVMITGMPFLFIAPLSIRLFRYPLVLATAFVSIWTLFKPNPTLHDASLVFSLLLLSPRSLARMGNASIVSLFALFVPVTLFVLDYWLWLEVGSGNANYMFFQCLAYNVFLGVIFLDFVGSTVKRDKALRLTEKTRRAKEFGETQQK